MVEFDEEILALSDVEPLFSLLYLAVLQLDLK